MVALLGHSASSHRPRPDLVQSAASSKGPTALTQTVAMGTPITSGSALILVVAAPLNYANYVEISGGGVPFVWLTGLNNREWQVDYYRGYGASGGGSSVSIGFRSPGSEAIAQLSEWTRLGPSTTNEVDFAGAFSVGSGTGTAADTGAASSSHLPPQGGLCIGHCLRQVRSEPTAGPTNGWTPLIETKGGAAFQLSSAYKVQVDAEPTAHSTQWTFESKTSWSAGFLILKAAPPSPSA